MDPFTVQDVQRSELALKPTKQEGTDKKEKKIGGNTNDLFTVLKSLQDSLLKKDGSGEEGLKKLVSNPNVKVIMLDEQVDENRPVKDQVFEKLMQAVGEMFPEDEGDEEDGESDEAKGEEADRNEDANAANLDDSDLPLDETMDEDALFNLLFH